MKELRLIDRVVVEIKDAVCDDCPNEFVAAKLREIADLIESGIKGGDIAKSEDFTHEVLWEHECPRYGGFRMGDKSLICQDYYHSEPKPVVVSDETRKDIERWRERFEDESFSDGDLVDLAKSIFDKITWEE